MSILITLLLIIGVFAFLHLGVKKFVLRVWLWLATLLVSGILAGLAAGNKLGPDLSEQIFQSAIVYLILGGFIGIFYVFINRGIHYAQIQWQLYEKFSTELNGNLQVPPGNMAKVFQHPTFTGTFQGHPCLVQQFKTGKYTYTGLRLETDIQFPSIQVGWRNTLFNAYPAGWDKLSTGKAVSESPYVLYAPEPILSLHIWNQVLENYLSHSADFEKNESLRLYGNGIEIIIPMVMASEKQLEKVKTKLQFLMQTIPVVNIQ